MSNVQRVVWKSNKKLKDYPEQLWKNSWYLLPEPELKLELNSFFDYNNFVNKYVNESNYRQIYDLTPAPVETLKLDKHNIPNKLVNTPVFFKRSYYYTTDTIHVYLTKLKELTLQKLQCRKCQGLNIVNPDLPLNQQTPVGLSYSFEPVLTVIGQSLHSYSLYTPKFQIPFKGNIPQKDSGYLLYTALLLGGYIERWNLNIVNIVACHPVNNQPNNPVWVSNCKPIFVKELQITKPNMLLCVGNSAKTQVFKLITEHNIELSKALETKFTQTFKLSTPLFGTIKYIITTYHPSYIQRRYTLFSEPAKSYILDLANALKTVSKKYLHLRYITLKTFLEKTYPNYITFYKLIDV